MYASMKTWWMSGEWRIIPEGGAMVIPTPVITHLFAYIDVSGIMLRRVRLSLLLHASMLRAFISTLPLLGRRLKQALTSINLRSAMLRKAVSSIRLKGLNLDFVNKILELTSLLDLFDELEKVSPISPLFFYLSSFKRRLLGYRKKRDKVK